MVAPIRANDSVGDGGHVSDGNPGVALLTSLTPQHR